MTSSPKAKISKKPKTVMRLFYLERHEDESGVSGVGIIAEGVELSNGKCILSWLTQHHSVAVYDNMKELVEIHGHNGKTVLKYY